MLGVVLLNGQSRYITDYAIHFKVKLILTKLDTVFQTINLLDN